MRTSLLEFHFFRKELVYDHILPPFWANTKEKAVTTFSSGHCTASSCRKGLARAKLARTQASLLELDRTKLPEPVRAAREAIHQRLIQEKETLTWEEHAEINDA